MHTERDQVNNNPSKLDKMTTNDNLSAFLYMIRKAEGTASENGYRYLFGSTYGHEKLFNSYADHPKKFFDYTDKAGKTVVTSAAGAYQITYTTWKALKMKISLPDFSPSNQDKAAIQLITEKKGAIDDIKAGRFISALDKVRKIWASLPGSGNNQPERSIAKVTEWYQKAGGKIV